ncbi:toluene monooxygenase [Brevibacterium oceani]|uniref:toluene monooxygenase n=1 Tax=Brevibacterium oceani TaxID=358099 RepID=UPI001B31BCE2|nr:toluene monooxygenase [Brevibacterium oceani]
MSEEAARKPARKRKQRTFSAFGDVRRMPSEYEIVTHGQNWNTRNNESSVFEQNPSSAGNLWFLTYRENSPLQADDWEAFRDPDQISYRSYVNLQAGEQSKIDGVLENYGDAGADDALSDEQVRMLGTAFTPSRFLAHGFQQAEAYIGFIGPSSVVTSAAGYANADFLRRVSVIAYRTRALQIAHPGSGIGERERELWEQDPAWQPARKAIERALIAYDWGEAFTSVNLVLGPTLDDVLIRQFGEVSRENGDEQSWLLSNLLAADTARRGRWSSALARYALDQRPTNEKPLHKWIDRWSVAADEAAAALAPLLGRTADHVVGEARASREQFHQTIFDVAEEAS